MVVYTTVALFSAHREMRGAVVFEPSRLSIENAAIDGTQPTWMQCFCSLCGASRKEHFRFILVTSLMMECGRVLPTGAVGTISGEPKRCRFHFNSRSDGK